MIATDAAKRSEQADTMTLQRSTDGSMCTDKVIILDPKYIGIEGWQEHTQKLPLLLQAETIKTR